MKLKIITPLLIAMAISTFTSCSSSSESVETTDLNTYTINATENRDVPLDAQIVSASTEEAQVKITRDVEADSMNVYVIRGSVEVTEASTEE